VSPCLVCHSYSRQMSKNCRIFAQLAESAMVPCGILRYPAGVPSLSCCLLLALKLVPILIFIDYIPFYPSVFSSKRANLAALPPSTSGALSPPLGEYSPPPGILRWVGAVGMQVTSLGSVRDSSNKLLPSCQLLSCSLFNCQLLNWYSAASTQLLISNQLFNCTQLPATQPPASCQLVGWSSSVNH
jgi:hypothetical protein